MICSIEKTELCCIAQICNFEYQIAIIVSNKIELNTNTDIQYNHFSPNKNHFYKIRLVHITSHVAFIARKHFKAAGH